jgi:regulator of sirC expression with transglutaminase-like and TPR domain
VTVDAGSRRAFLAAVESPECSVAEAAFHLAHIDQPEVEWTRTLAELDRLGEEARRRMPAVDRRARIDALCRFLYGEAGFHGDHVCYEEPRNSCLNEVLARRAGIPITLAVVLIEVGARAGLTLEGVNFPGHFLVRDPGRLHPHGSRDILIDPFHAGIVISRADCLQLLRAHAGEEAALDPSMFRTAGKREILLRMLLNLKRSYVRLHAFPQARDVTELLLALEPSGVSELRDRGLLSYHLNDFSPALRDLQGYLALAAPPADEDTKAEYAQIREHVKTLRKRIASFN